MPSKISVGDPIGLAMSRTGEVLFRPFRFSKWFILALPAGLTILMEGGFNFPNFNGGGGGRPRPIPCAPGGPFVGLRPPTFQDQFQEAYHAVQGYIGLIIAGLIVAFIVAVLVWMLCRWLNSRGRFMFFDNLVNNDTRIKAPWSDFRQIARSLWIVRLLWDLIRSFVFLAIYALLFFIALPDLRHYYQTGDYNFTGASTTALVVGIPFFLIAIFVFWIMSSILFHLAIPAMYVRRMNAMPAIKIAWREMFLPHIGSSILYFLFLFLVQIVWLIWFMIALIALCVVTLCIGYILAVIPVVSSYVHALITLPVIAFKNTYKLHFISQFGDDYRLAWQSNPQGGFPVILNDPQPPSIPPPV